MSRPAHFTDQETKTQITKDSVNNSADLRPDFQSGALSAQSWGQRTIGRDQIN
jgi:hypothetical protein